MASNLTVTFPPATGAPLPPVELAPFGNESASTKDSLQNYVDGVLLPTTPVTCYAKPQDQYIKGRQEYPR